MIYTLSTSLLSLAFAGLLLLAARSYLSVLCLRRNLPPGPFPLPIFGNFFLTRRSRPWIHWETLSQQYNSPLITLWQGSRPFIVCNDAWTASELFEKRAPIYSSRPHLIMMGDLLDISDANQVCLVYGDKWRLHRKLTHSVVGSQAVRKYRKFQGDEGKILLRDLLERPDDYVMAIERYSVSTASFIGWGRRIDKMNDYVAQRALDFMEGVNFIIPGQFLMEAFPWLYSLPWFLNPIPRLVKKTSRKVHRYFYELSQEAAAQTNSEKPTESFAHSLVTAQIQNGISDTEIAQLTANLIGGGVDTTSSTLISLILALATFPEAQRTAHEELDRVVGRNRMPDWEDEAHLPYISAIVSEVLRWRTVTVLGGLPHAPIQDDVYMGYHIPKDTWIVGNIWAIHRHPRDYPDPDSFRPERFLPDDEEDGKNNNNNKWKRPHPSKKGHSAFGWGRRQCSGQPLAEQGLFIATARLLWAFEVRPGIDGEGGGKEVELDIFAFTASENQRPVPFSARFLCRGENEEEKGRMRERILVEAEKARRELERFDGESALRV